jgi:methionine-rich copper-binding protein CopC
MTVRRWAAALSLVGALLALPAVAAAHAELVASDPAAGAVLSVAPSAVELTFDGELDPDGSGFTVLGPSGGLVGAGEVDLQVAERNVLSGDVDATADGAYEVRWTAVSIDGHAEEGSLAFSVGTEAAAPNTALPGPIDARPVGILLIVLGAGLAIARRRAPFLMVALAVGLAACVSDTRPSSCDADAVRIELTLTAAALAPSDPAVCRDQDVTLVVDSETDGVLHIHGYDEAVPATTVEAGEQVVLEFTATRSGQFPIEVHTSDEPEGQAVGIFTVHEP